MRAPLPLYGQESSACAGLEILEQLLHHTEDRCAVDVRCTAAGVGIQALLANFQTVVLHLDFVQSDPCPMICLRKGRSERQDCSNIVVSAPMSGKLPIDS
jgi:hypothetical protein